MKHLKWSAVVMAGVLVMSVLPTNAAQRGQGMGQGMDKGMGKNMMERFSKYDANGDGLISAAESVEWQESVFAAMDADDDGKLSQDEFMALHMGKGADPAMRGRKYALRQEEKAKRFTMMDVDKDGYVTKEQFMTKGKERFKKFDTDGDGALSMMEFRAARMQRKMQRN